MNDRPSARKSQGGLAIVTGLLVAGIPAVALSETAILHVPKLDGFEVMRVATVLALPGIFMGSVASGNLHVPNMAISFVVNWVFYGVIVYGFLRLRRSYRE